MATLAAGLAAAATIVVAFPEFDGPPIPDGPFPQSPVTIGAQTFSIPAGDRIASAVISGFWGTSTKPDSTAGVTVFLDGVEVARCEKPDTGCWIGDMGQRSWQHTFTQPELLPLRDGTATMTAVQTSDLYIRLGVSTLVIETVPLAIVPTLSPLGLLALLAAMAVAGMLAVKRYRRG
jgi:hypothetical protein